MAATLTHPTTDGWSRNHLRTVLVLVACAGLFLAGGLGFALYLAITSATGHYTTTTSSAATTWDKNPGMTSPVARGEEQRNRIAAAPMLRVSAEAMKPADPIADVADPISIPEPTNLSRAGVLTGFPRTPEGAVGQLAQIEVTVLQAMSLTTAHQVHQAWALPGAVSAEEWELTDNVQTFLAASDMGATKTLTSIVTVEPVGALVKGSDGPDWTVACVLAKVTALINTEARIAYGYCERMTWTPTTPTADTPVTAAGGHEGRWMIAPGSPPVHAPSTWPGTQPALEAGWLTWITTTQPPAPTAEDDAQQDQP